MLRSRNTVISTIIIRNALTKSLDVDSNMKNPRDVDSKVDVEIDFANLDMIGNVKNRRLGYVMKSIGKEKIVSS